MSGGHFDFSYFPISEFALQLQHEIDTNNENLTVDDSFEWHGYQFTAETIELLQKSQKIIEVAGQLAHHIDYLYSCDIGEESFMVLAKQELEKIS